MHFESTEHESYCNVWNRMNKINVTTVTMLTNDTVPSFFVDR